MTSSRVIMLAALLTVLALYFFSYYAFVQPAHLTSRGWIIRKPGYHIPPHLRLGYAASDIDPRVLARFYAPAHYFDSQLVRRAYWHSASPAPRRFNADDFPTKIRSPYSDYLPTQ